MKTSDIKRIIDKMEPDAGLQERLAKNMKKSTNKRFVSIAAGLVVLILVTTLATQLIGNNKGKNNDKLASNEGVYIPKLELQEDTNIKASMIGLIVYQGKIYTQGSMINPEDAKNLLGEKLGTTKGNITEWSKQEDYAVELASTIGIQDVFEVKGYDKAFRIMSYQEIDGEIYAQIFECLNDMTIVIGSDLYKKFEIENNIKEVAYESFDSWNNGKLEYQPMTNIEGLNDFLIALGAATPYEQETLSNLFEDQSEGNQKFVYITLKDGTSVELRLFKDGYVFYTGAHIFFKVDTIAFESFWNMVE